MFPKARPNLRFFQLLVSAAAAAAVVVVVLRRKKITVLVFAHELLEKPLDTVLVQLQIRTAAPVILEDNRFAKS